MSRRSRGEHGAAAVVIAIITCFTLIPLAAYAVDIGVQRVARRDMQSLADVVALDLARKLDGSKDAATLLASFNGAGGLAATSAARNASTVGDPDVREVVAEVGTTDPAEYGTDAYFTVVTGSTVPTAVRVTASTAVDFNFAGGHGGASRSAIAVARTSACFQIGSYAASVTPGAAPLFKDLLSPLLGSSTLGLAGYNGLASTRLSILDLVNTGKLGVGTVEELATLDDLRVGDLYLAAAQVLTGQGKIAQANVFSSAAASVVAPVHVDPFNLLALDTTGDSAASAQLNALDLLVGSAFLADGDHLVGIPNLQTGLSSIGVTNTELSIIEAPRWKCNDEVARTAQVKLSSSIKASLSNSPLVSLAGSLLRMVDPASGSPSGDLAMALNVQVAGAHARLTSTKCQPDIFQFDVWRDLATVQLSGTTRIKGTVAVSANLFGLLDPLRLLPSIIQVPVELDVEVRADGTQPAEGTAQQRTLSIPPQSYADPATPTTAGTPRLPTLTVQAVAGSLRTGPVTLLGIPISTSLLDSLVSPILTATLLPAVANRILPVVTPLLDKVNTTVLDPLMKGMGITVAGADVFGIPSPQCNAPKLVG